LRGALGATVSAGALGVMMGAGALGAMVGAGALGVMVSAGALGVMVSAGALGATVGAGAAHATSRISKSKKENFFIIILSYELATLYRELPRVSKHSLAPGVRHSFG